MARPAIRPASQRQPQRVPLAVCNGAGAQAPTASARRANRGSQPNHPCASRDGLSVPPPALQANPAPPPAGRPIRRHPLHTPSTSATMTQRLHSPFAARNPNAGPGASRVTQAPRASPAPRRLINAATAPLPHPPASKATKPAPSWEELLGQRWAPPGFRTELAKQAAKPSIKQSIKASSKQSANQSSKQSSNQLSNQPTRNSGPPRQGRGASSSRGSPVWGWTKLRRQACSRSRWAPRRLRALP